MYALLLDNRSRTALAEQVFAAASGYNAGAGAAASWTLIKVLNMCMIVLGRSHGVISSRSPAGRHEPGAPLQRQVPAPPPPDINRIAPAGQNHAAIFRVKSKPHPSEKMLPEARIFRRKILYSESLFTRSSPGADAPPVRRSS